MKKLLIVPALILLAGCVHTGTTQQPATGDTQEETVNEEQSFATNGCLTITSPAIGETVSFPLTVEGTIDYGCRMIFEWQAWVVTIEKNGQVISPVDTSNALFIAQSNYRDPNNFPVTAETTISHLLSGTYTGAAELVITPDDPCGNAPDCPPDEEPVRVPIVLP